MFKCFQCVLVLVLGGLKGVRVCGIVVYWDPDCVLLQHSNYSVSHLTNRGDLCSRLEFYLDFSQHYTLI
jgi:hypothetical protein